MLVRVNEYTSEEGYRCSFASGSNISLPSCAWPWRRRRRSNHSVAAARSAPAEGGGHTRQSSWQPSDRTQCMHLLWRPMQGSSHIQSHNSWPRASKQGCLCCSLCCNDNHAPLPAATAISCCNNSCCCSVAHSPPTTDGTMMAASGGPPLPCCCVLLPNRLSMSSFTHASGGFSARQSCETRFSHRYVTL